MVPKNLPFSSTISNKQKPLTECPSLLFPVCLSLHPPYLLLLCMFFFFCSLLVNWLLAEPFDLELTVFHSVYNEQKVLGLKACARVLGLSHTTTRNRLFQSEKKKAFWRFTDRSNILQQQDGSILEIAIVMGTCVKHAYTAYCKEPSSYFTSLLHYL